MVINIDLPPEENADWLHTESEGLFSLSDEERTERANEAQITAIKEKLVENGGEHASREDAKEIFEQFSEEEFRDVMKAALEKECDCDYLDRIAQELIDQSNF